MADTAFADDITSIGDKIAGLTIVQAVQLKDYLKEKYKIEPAAGGGMMMAPAAAGPAAEVAGPRRSSLSFWKASTRPRRSGHQGRARDRGPGPGRGEGLCRRRPKTVKENITKEDAEKIKKQIEDAGGKVAIK